MGNREERFSRYSAQIKVFIERVPVKKFGILGDYGETEDVIGESESTVLTETRIYFSPTNNSTINVE